MVEILLTSGAVTGGEEILRRLIRAGISAIKQGDVRTRAKLLPKVALKKGGLRRGFNKAFDAQTIKLTGTTQNIKIELVKTQVVALSPKGFNYARVHINPGGNYGTSYRKPTTGGTRPTSVDEWNSALILNTKAALPTEFIRQGLRIV